MPHEDGLVQVLYGGPADSLSADGYLCLRGQAAEWPLDTALRAISGLPEHSLTIVQPAPVDDVVVDSPLTNISINADPPAEVPAPPAEE